MFNDDGNVEAGGESHYGYPSILIFLLKMEEEIHNGKRRMETVDGSVSQWKKKKLIVYICLGMSQLQKLSASESRAHLLCHTPLSPTRPHSTNLHRETTEVSLDLESRSIYSGRSLADLEQSLKSDWKFYLCPICHGEPGVPTTGWLSPASVSSPTSQQQDPRPVFRAFMYKTRVRMKMRSFWVGIVDMRMRFGESETGRWPERKDNKINLFNFRFLSSKTRKDENEWRWEKLDLVIISQVSPFPRIIRVVSMCQE